MKIYSLRCSLFLLLGAIYSATAVAQKPVAKKTVVVATAAKPYANGVQLNVKGFTVKEAFLVFDDETKVPADNKVDINQRVTLRIVLARGFKEIEGKVFPGGKEKIVLSNGETILDSEDLFTAYESTGVSPEDAKYISLKAVITELKDKKNYVKVSFRVWDKKTVANEITGSYKLYIK
ncbi:hypothetical protein [Ferruginibacter profundus]